MKLSVQATVDPPSTALSREAAAFSAKERYMNVNCPHCATVFRVDPEKVPRQGVRTRCSICRGTFRVEPERHDEAIITSPAPPAPPAPVEVAPPAAEPAPAPVASAPAAPARSRPPGFAFGAADPAAKARRLARALVSDIVTYHPERRDQALREGTLKREFKDEIRKSWEEYVEQVGTETALGTPHFRDALNELLARGQKVF